MFANAQLAAAVRRALAGADYATALRGATQLSRAAPGDWRALLFLAAAQRGMGDFGEARRTLEKAIKIRPGEVAIMHDLALTARRDGRFDDAIRWCERARRAAPGDVQVAAALSDVLGTLGRWPEAYQAIEPLLATHPSDLDVGAAFARCAARVGKAPQAAEYLERALAASPPGGAALANVLFLLGSLYDGLGEYDRAFAAYERANAERAVRFDPAGFRAKVDAAIAAWTPGAVAALPSASGKGDRAVFVVGMPRSSTTLVEQILASHPGVYGAGELREIGRRAHEWSGTMSGNVPLLTDPGALTRERVERGAREYEAVQRSLSPVAARVTDKMPLNCLHLGLIDRMLPAARVIHCVRDPMDTCVSCYFHNFTGSNPWSYDLTHLGLFYRQYERMVEHWRRVLRLPILDVPYERLVERPEEWSRRIVDFAGLPWDPACLNFHENKRVVLTASNDQVRRPMFTSSVARWKHYEKHLGPLKKALGVE